MGISSKWIKTLVGIKKHGKRRNAECSDTVRRRVFIELMHGAAVFCLQFWSVLTFLHSVYAVSLSRFNGTKLYMSIINGYVLHFSKELKPQRASAAWLVY
jgi:hypothetical protein